MLAAALIAANARGQKIIPLQGKPPIAAMRWLVFHLALRSKVLDIEGISEIELAVGALIFKELSQCTCHVEALVL
ncbi:hypothetical protein CHY08_27140 (plasmid) [Rhizobium leguminosarum bv. viciae]|nr:hypothetical protein CHY08_27140 [Rhizobium leguminosarum bv. viciae]